MAGCAKEVPPAPPAELTDPGTVHDVPANSSIGGLYGRVQAHMAEATPDILASLRDTLGWARAHLDRFGDGACGSVQVVADADFGRIFGRSTLGVTLPWMQVYVRDGNREGDTFLWKDPSLFVSTVLHEFVHVAQRARQSTTWLGSGGACEAARSALTGRKPTWNNGFELLKGASALAEGYTREERALLYGWVSPIERARDEIDAAITTVKWMHDHPDELGELTAGGVNNWVYGVQYLNQAKTMAHGNCFSADDETYANERHIFEVEMPAYVAQYQIYESGMKAYLVQHSQPSSRLGLADLSFAVTPTGRDGSKCNSGLLPDMPNLPVPEGRLPGDVAQ